MTKEDKLCWDFPSWKDFFLKKNESTVLNFFSVQDKQPELTSQIYTLGWGEVCLGIFTADIKKLFDERRWNILKSETSVWTEAPQDFTEAAQLLRNEHLEKEASDAPSVCLMERLSSSSSSSTLKPDTAQLSDRCCLLAAVLSNLLKCSYTDVCWVDDKIWKKVAGTICVSVLAKHNKEYQVAWRIPIGLKTWVFIKGSHRKSVVLSR